MSVPTSPNGRPEPDEIAAVAALAPYLTAIRSHWRLVTGIMLVALLTSFAWVRHEGTTYEASASILVAPIPPQDVALSGLPLLRAGEADTSRSVKTAADLLQTDEAAERTARELGDVDSQTIESSVEVTANTDSDLVEVTAKSGSAERSAEIANAYADAALELRAEELRPVIDRSAEATRRALESLQDPTGEAADLLRARLSALEALDGDPSLSIARLAHPPSAPTGSPLWLVLGLALIGGFVLGAVSAVLSEVLAPRVLRDEGDLVSVVPRRVLARTPEIPRRALLAGRERRRAAAGREAFRSLRAQLELRAADRRPLGFELEDPDHGGRAILITSASRGDGRTQAAIELARAFGSSGSSVVIVDADFRRMTGGGEFSGGGLTAVAEGAELAAAVQPVSGIPSGGVLSAPSGLSLAEIEMLSARLPAVVAAARGTFDWVVIDAPPLAAAGHALALAGAVEEVLIVVRRNHTRLIDLVRLRELLKQTAAQATGYLFVGGVKIADPQYDYGEEEPLTRAGLPGEARLRG
jgi:Mrp family chromosome partitioning ATPase